MTSPALQLAASIPQELRDRKSWLVWKLEERKGQPKPTKVPYCAPGKKVSVTDVAALLSYPEAVALAARGFDGIGFVFQATDPWTGIDFDSCRDPVTGTWDS